MTNDIPPTVPVPPPDDQLLPVLPVPPEREQLRRPAGPLAEILAEVAAERARQDARWGEQNHPDGTERSWELPAKTMRSICQDHAAAGTVTWSDILREEVYEALAEADPARLRAELIQVAAVTVAWIEAIDRVTR